MAGEINLMGQEKHFLKDRLGDRGGWNTADWNRINTSESILLSMGKPGCINPQYMSSLSRTKMYFFLWGMTKSMKAMGPGAVG